MQEQDDLNPADREFETALRNLAPAAGKVDSISAAFAAGKRSTVRRLHRWQSGVALLVLINVGMWFLRNRSEVITTAPPQSIAVIAPTVRLEEPLSDQSLAVMQQRVLEHGVDALPATKLPNVQPARMRDAL